jgi:spore photoproduct lyase
MKSENAFYNPAFSHIYVEKTVLDSDAAAGILKRLPDAKVIEIKHYKDVFNKPGQNPGAQKNSRKLILAQNTGRKVYPGAPYCHDFGHSRFFYTSQVLNCPFDCSYCYLKGKFPSADIVAFVNTNDYLMELDSVLDSDDAFVTLSYDSDMAALEPLLGLLDGWYEYMRLQPDATFELRTKSLYRPLCGRIDNLIIAVSLLPQQVIDLYESGTPSYTKRIQHAKTLLAAGYRIRLAIDPILDIDDANEIYSSFAYKLGETIDLSKITGVSAGCFRMPADYYKNMCRGYGGHHIHYYPFETIEKQVRYSKEREAELITAVTAPLSRLMDKSKIYVR